METFMAKEFSLGLMDQDTKESTVMERSTEAVHLRIHQERLMQGSGVMVSKKEEELFLTHSQIF